MSKIYTFETVPLLPRCIKVVKMVAEIYAKYELDFILIGVRIHALYIDDE